MKAMREGPAARRLGFTTFGEPKVTLVIDREREGTRPIRITPMEARHMSLCLIYAC